MKTVEITDSEFKRILHYLEKLLYELEENKYGKYTDELILKEFITELEKKKSDDNEKPPDTIELIITRLLEQKRKIYDELAQKYKKIALNEDWSVDKLVNVFNKKEPELMGQLFFLDMELRNLGYGDNNK